MQRLHPWPTIFEVAICLASSPGIRDRAHILSASICVIREETSY